MKKKILPVVLALCMALTLLPVTALAAKEGDISTELTKDSSDELTWGSSTTATSAVSIDSTSGEVPITLESGPITLTGAITIKGSSGVTISGAQTLNASGGITVEGSSKLTISDLTGLTGTITLQTGAKLKVGDSNEYTAEGGEAQVTVSGGASAGKIALTSGKVKTTTAGSVSVNSKELTISGTEVTVNATDGSVTGDTSDSVTCSSVIYAATGSSLNVTFGASDITVVSADVSNLTSGNTIKVDGKTYTGDTSAASLTVTGGNVTATAGTVQLGSGAKVSLTDGKAKNGSSGKEISGNGVTVTGGDGSATVEGDVQVTVEGTKNYTLANTGKMTVADNGTATLNAGKVTLGGDAEVTVNSTKVKGNTVVVESTGTVTVPTTVTATIGTGKTYKADGGAATLNVTAENNVTLNSGTVELGGSAAVKTGVITGGVSGNGAKVKDDNTVTSSAAVTVGGKTWTPDGEATLTFASADVPSVTSGKVTLSGGATATVAGESVSGNNVKVESDKVTVTAGSTATIGSDTFLATTGDSELTVSSSGVDVTEIKDSGTLKVTNSGSDLNVKYKNITFKGDEYTLSDDSGTAKVEVADSKNVTVTFSGADELKVNGTLKTGGQEISESKLTGTSGASVKLAGGSDETTATGEGGVQVTTDGKVTTPSSSPSSSGSSTTPSTTTTQPSTDTESETTTVDVNVNSTTSGTTANATVSENSMNNAVKSVVEAAEKAGTAPVVEIDVKTSSTAKSLNVILPKSSLETLSKAENASLVVTSDVAEVALDNAALTSLAKQATGNTVTLEVAPVAETSLSEAQKKAVGDNPVVDLELVSNGTVIHDYNGGVITVTLPYALPENHDPKSVKVCYLDDNGKLTPCGATYDAETGEVQFTTTHLSKYVITSEEVHDCPSTKYTDVKQSKWYHEGIDYVVENGLMEGDGELFSPNGDITRGMFVTILYNLEGKPEAPANTSTFTDVAVGKWYADAVAWAVENKIVDGYGDGTFLPNEPITREQMATLLYRYAEYKGYELSETADLSGYTDAGKVSSWATTAMQWAVGEGLIDGTDDTTLDPSGSATRAMAATIIMRFCEEISK